MRSQKHRHGSHWSLLDCRLPDTRRTRICRDVSQCPSDQKCSGTKNRHPGLPVDSAVAHLWIVARFLSPQGSLLRLAHLSSLSRRIDRCPEHSMPAYAKSSTADECATASGIE